MLDQEDNKAKMLDSKDGQVQETHLALSEPRGRKPTPLLFRVLQSTIRLLLL